MSEATRTPQEWVDACGNTPETCEKAKAAILQAVERNEQFNKNTADQLFKWHDPLPISSRWAEDENGMMALGPDYDPETWRWVPFWIQTPEQYLQDRHPNGGYGVHRTTMGTVRNKTEAQAMREHKAGMLIASREGSRLNSVSVKVHHLKRKLPKGYVLEGEFYVKKS